ncbi:hypothetical protein GCM10028807_29620 [Spirosoma daeguense]
MNTTSKFRLALLALFMTATTFTTHAQKPTNKLAPREGFWVVETSPKSKQSTVRFYDDRQKLIYEETMDYRLNIARTRIKQQLNAALEQAIFVWNNTQKMPTDRQWVAVQLARK